MAAKKKSASRRSAAKAKSKTGTKRPAAKKTVARKPKPAPKKAAARRKKPAPGAKVPAARAPARKAPVRKAAARKAAARTAPPSPALVEIDQRIAIVQNNLRELMEQASGSSGSATEELLSDRITAQEAELQRLRQERDALEKG